MKKILLVLCLLACPASAATLTPCSGSWDGPGQTACELLGSPGQVGGATGIDWSLYVVAPVQLYEITFYDDENTLRIDQLGQLVYERAPGHPVWASLLHPTQFATWCTPDGRDCTVAIEDLSLADLTGSDYDYNDYVVAVRRPDATTFRETPIPEPVLLLLAGLGTLAAVRRRKAA